MKLRELGQVLHRHPFRFTVFERGPGFFDEIAVRIEADNLAQRRLAREDCKLDHFRGTSQMTSSFAARVHAV